MSETRRYVWKLYPASEQAAILHEQRKMMADLWNALKQRREDVYRREGRSLSYFDLTNEITTLRHECPEWAAIPSVTSHRVARWLTLSYEAFFRRVKAGETAGYPGWRRRERGNTIPLGTMDKTGWHVERCDANPFNWRLHYKSVTEVKDRSTWIHARGRLPGSPGDQRENVASRRRMLASHSFAVSAWRNADIIWRDGSWWLSVCMDVAPRRSAGRFPVAISFDLLDNLATVNGMAETPGELLDAQALQDEVDRLKSERDIRWPRSRKIPDDEREALQEANGEISSLSAAVARKRKNALHVWTARIVARASDITIVAPPLREVVRSPRGDDKQWGANIGIVSELNRHLLSQAPGSAIQMLRYKSAEAGIRCDVVTDEAPNVAVGGELVTAGKTLRRARRETRRAA
jgi:putative transposase